MSRPSALARSTVVLTLAVALGCQRDPPSADAKPAPPPAPAATTEEIASPALPGTGSPELSNSPAGLVIASWLEPAEAGAALRMAVVQSGEWSPPRTVASGALVVNWADRPSIVTWGYGSLAAHWLESDPRQDHAQLVRVSVSRDNGRSWSEPVTPHGEGPPAENGFASLVDLGDSFGIAWLDGRRMAGGDHAAGGDMELRWTTFRDSLAEEVVLDPRACECCPTAAARFGQDVIVAYRDRSEENVRDIAVVRLHEGAWTAPAVVHADGWKVDGCPVNGPALAASIQSLALAWFTVTAEGPRVLFALSSDGGATFGEPVRIDDGSPIGRVDVATLQDGSFAVGWLESGPEGATFRVRRVSGDAEPGPSQTVAPVSSGRDSGYPRLARQGEHVVAAWTDTSGPEPSLRTVRLKLLR